MTQQQSFGFCHKPQRPIKLVLGTLLALLICSIMVFAKEGMIPEEFPYHPSLYKVTGIVLFLGYLFWLRKFLKKLKAKIPVLTIGPEGINDESTPFSVGLIAWKDITKIYKMAKGKDVPKDTIMIEVVDQATYVNRQNFLKKQMLSDVLKNFKTPVIALFDDGLLECDFNELYMLLTQQLELSPKTKES